MKIIAANFKTNHTRASTREYINTISEFIQAHTIENEIYIFPSFISLDHFDLPKTIHVGVQNGYAISEGSLTGEIGSKQLDEFNINTMLIGHSERRHTLGESQTTIKDKYKYYSELGYKIVYCVGEPLEIKEQGVEKTLSYIRSQLEGIDLSYSNVIVAYEPVWAIGTGVSATLEDIIAVHEALKSFIDKPILYGGSVNSSNVNSIASLKCVDGVLIGTASWDQEVFCHMIGQINQSQGVE